MEHSKCQLISLCSANYQMLASYGPHTIRHHQIWRSCGTILVHNYVYFAEMFWPNLRPCWHQESDRTQYWGTGDT